jgi:V8-like Glu-specific endopeptidase
MATSRRSSRPSAPLTPEQLLERDNVPASEALADDIASRLSTKTLFISGVRAPIKSVKSAADKRAHEFHLPKQAVIGLRGRSAVRMKRPRGSKRPRRSLAGHRPKWAEHVYHPKRSTAQAWARGPAHRPGYRGEVFYGVFGSDDRAVYYPSGYPWQCVGKIYAWTDASASSPAWSGSAVLIGPRLALTAGHVVPWDATSWMMRFVPAYYDGTSVLGPGGESYVSDARGWDVSYRSRLPDAHDMAVLRLYEPLGDWLGYFGSKPYANSWTGNPYWNVTGYPDAVASSERPSYQFGITVIEAEASTDALDFEHQGDTTPGDSGAPFWATWPDGFPYVIGTVSGGEIFWDANGTVIEDHNDAAGGNAVNDLIRWGRTNWS